MEGSFRSKLVRASDVNSDKTQSYLFENKQPMHFISSKIVITCRKSDTFFIYFVNATKNKKKYFQNSTYAFQNFIYFKIHLNHNLFIYAVYKTFLNISWMPKIYQCKFIKEMTKKRTRRQQPCFSLTLLSVRWIQASAWLSPTPASDDPEAWSDIWWTVQSTRRSDRHGDEADDQINLWEMTRGGNLDGGGDYLWLAFQLLEHPLSF